MQSHFGVRSEPIANFRHGEAAIEQSSQKPLDDSLLSNWPCLKSEYKIQETEVDKETGVLKGASRVPRGANSIPFPISLKTVCFSLDVWRKQFKILAVSRFSHFDD
jgi:hypothetical protein